MRQEKQIDLLTCNVYLVQVISITSFSGDLPVNLNFVGIDIIIINLWLGSAFNFAWCNFSFVTRKEFIIILRIYIIYLL